MSDSLKAVYSAPVCNDSACALWLVDNGSLRADSVLALRRRAAALSQRLGCAVEAVSVLHSAKIPPEALGGLAAEVFAPALRARAAAGLRQLTVVPYFFGPSAALTDFLPKQIEKIGTEFPQLKVRITAPLVDLGTPEGLADERIVAALERAVMAQINDAGLADAAVVLVDHGSPLREVSRVRDHIGSLLRVRLLGSGRVRAFAVASMEAREGEEYRHTLPLFSTVLASEPFCSGAVVVAPLFLSPGRHAGAEGDLAEIAAAAQGSTVRECAAASQSGCAQEQADDVVMQENSAAVSECAAGTPMDGEQAHCNDAGFSAGTQSPHLPPLPPPHPSPPYSPHLSPHPHPHRLPRRIYFCKLAGEDDVLTDILADRVCSERALWRWPQQGNSADGCSE